MRQSLKQEFGCMRELSQGEKTKENRTRQRIKPREKAASPESSFNVIPRGAPEHEMHGESAVVSSLWMSHRCWGVLQGHLSRVAPWRKS